jgi:hypothetical protein
VTTDIHLYQSFPLRKQWSPLFQVPPVDGEILLNLTLGEPLALMKKLPCFDDTIELDVLLAGALHLGVHDSIISHMFNAFKIEFYRGLMLDHVRSVQERWKI